MSAASAASMRVLGLVLNYNGGDDVLACLASLASQSHDAFDVLVIDNASDDGSPDAIARDYPSVELIRNDANVGFCAGNNAGLDLAVQRGYDAVMLLNDDVILEPDCVRRLVDVLRHRGDVGVVGPKVLFDPERHLIWAAGGSIDFRQNLNRLRGFRCDRGRFQRSEDVGYVPGCAMLIRTTMLERVGRLNEDYFAYLEDVEFCYRVGAAGHRVFYEANAVVYHRVSRSSGARYGALRKYLNARNSVLFLRRHGTTARWAKFILFDVATLPAAWLVRAFRGESGAVRAKWRGLRAGWRGETGKPA